VRDFVAAVERVSGRKANVRSEPMPAADVRETCASIEKARKLLGYAPKTSVDVGVERVWLWYQRATRAR
jgi:UDP-glucuronate 4-epimerase